MISDLDETLRQLLIQRTPLDPTQVDINFEIPDREWSTGLAKPALNLYLYDIRENRELRELDWIAGHNEQGHVVHRRVPTRIDLSYLITAWTRAIEDEHRLLWQALATLFRHPLVPPELLQGILREQMHPLRLVTAQGDGVLKNPADFWAALDNQLKPSVNLVATVELDLGIVETAPPVTKVVIGATNIEGPATRGGAQRRRGGAQGPDGRPHGRQGSVRGPGAVVEELEHIVRPTEGRRP